MRICRLSREAQVVVRLRRFHYSQNLIASFLGRSTSFVHRILKFNRALGALRKTDLRKIPRRVRELSRMVQHSRLIRHWGSWEAYLLGEGDRPP